MSIEMMSAVSRADIRPSGRKFVLLALANYADKEGRCFPSVAQIAGFTGQAQKTVRDHLEALCAAELISRARYRCKDGTLGRYRFRLHREVLPAAKSARGEKGPAPAAKSAAHNRQLEPSPLSSSRAPAGDSWLVKDCAGEGRGTAREADALRAEPTGGETTGSETTGADTGAAGRGVSTLRQGSEPPAEDRSEQRFGREFSEWFWPAYPHKIGRPVALAAFVKARDKAGLAAIMAGLSRYAAKRDDRPWCNPATWLNQERWTDEPAACGPPRDKPGVSGMPGILGMPRISGMQRPVHSPQGAPFPETSSSKTILELIDERLEQNHAASIAEPFDGQFTGSTEGRLRGIVSGPIPDAEPCHGALAAADLRLPAAAARH
ncbi:helix-turn-helix domain-containing protein [Oryzifoliimicrobium ureilyticus]|uniref:helix-turn-helix domain-containing protein n=1 Tax=Oryzifoliimicrobium ureilyticus TaxID=3113724 RepID=UPI0030766137